MILPCLLLGDYKALVILFTAPNVLYCNQVLWLLQALLPGFDLVEVFDTM